MRRQFNGGPEPPNYGRPGLRSRFPPECDDPFAERFYNSSIYGGGGSFRDTEEFDRGGACPDDYSGYNYPAKFDNNRGQSQMIVENFFKMSCNNADNPFQRRIYGKYDLMDASPQQLNRSDYQYQNTGRQDDFQIENTRFGNNFTAFDEEFEEPVRKNLQSNPSTSQTFPVRYSTEIAVPGWNPESNEKQEKYKVAEIKCKVCNIMLTSKGVYEVHIQGKKHLKKEADAKKFSCDLCCTQMFTMEDQKAHNETEEHQESVKVAEFFEKQRNEDPDIQKVKALSYKMPNIITQSEIDAIKNTATASKDYRCDICKVICNAPQMLALHFSSKKHIKKANDFKLNSKSAAVQFSCDVCQFLCYTSEEHEAHSNSDEHSKCLAEKYKAGTIQTPAVPNEVMAAGIPKDELDVVPERGPDNILWYTCDTCNVKTNSLENYKMHINSKKHKTKATQPGAQLVNKKAKYSSEALRNSYTRFVSGGGLGKKITGDPGAYCARCEIQFKTPGELEEHFLTLAHKNHNPYKKKLFFDNEHSAKKAKLNNGVTSAITGNISTMSKVRSTAQATPLPTSDYGYGNYDHWQIQNTTRYSSSSSYPGSYQTASSAYQANYQSPGSYGYSTTGGYNTTSGYYSNKGYTGYDSQPAYSTESQPSSYSYSTPFYQH